MRISSIFFKLIVANRGITALAETFDYKNYFFFLASSEKSAIKSSDTAPIECSIRIEHISNLILLIYTCLIFSKKLMYIKFKFNI